MTVKTNKIIGLDGMANTLPVSTYLLIILLVYKNL